MSIYVYVHVTHRAYNAIANEQTELHSASAVALLCSYCSYIALHMDRRSRSGATRCNHSSILQIGTYISLPRYNSMYIRLIAFTYIILKRVVTL